MAGRRTYRNLLLAQLPGDARERLDGDLEDVPLTFKQQLHEQEQPVSALYFPETAVASMVTELADGTIVETGTIGYEGVTGVPSALTGAPFPATMICQIAGSGFKLPVRALARELEMQNSPLIHVIHKYLNYKVAMLAQGSACNRAHPVDARLARWLLMTHDRVNTDAFSLTQEFLAMMLGVQRPTVNIAAATLQRAGFIHYTRGRIAVLDRTGLETAACDCYAFLVRQLDGAVGEAAGRGGTS